MITIIVIFEQSLRTPTCSSNHNNDSSSSGSSSNNNKNKNENTDRDHNRKIPHSGCGIRDQGFEITVSI